MRKEGTRHILDSYVPYPSLTSLGQAPPEQSSVASLECMGHQQGLHKGFSSPQRKNMGAFTRDMRLSTLACSQQATGGFAARLDRSTRRWLQEKDLQPPSPSHPCCPHGSIPTLPEPPPWHGQAWEMLCGRAAMGAGAHPPYPAPSQARQWN